MRSASHLEAPRLLRRRGAVPRLPLALTWPACAALYLVAVASAPWLLPAAAEEAERPPQATPAGAGGPVRTEILICHTNDLHGQVLPQKAIWVRKTDPPLCGGLETLGTMIRQGRREAEEAGMGFLYLHAGDYWQGTPEGDGTEGQVMVAWFNEVGLNGLALGNHDFDAGAHRLVPMLAQSSFPVLCANIFELETGKVPSFCRSSVELRVKGIRIAVIGVISSDTKRVSSPKATRGLDFRTEFDAVGREVARARGLGAEVVILLSHSGKLVDRELGRYVRGIDVILGGYDHQAVHERISETGTLIHATYSKGSTLGRVHLVVQDGRVVEKRAALQDAFVDRFPGDKASRTILEEHAVDERDCG
ncbi:bifunctional metallophosphatase/5'-nucleotidase [Planctomycetota bacterium]